MGHNPGTHANILHQCHDVVNALDTPVPSVGGQYALRRGFLRRATGNPQCDLTRVLTGFFLDDFPLDQKDLSDVGEGDVGIECGAAPNAPRLYATVIGRCDLDEVWFLALLKQQSDITFQRWLVTLYGEMVVRLLLDQIGSQRALGQQSIRRDVLAGQVAGFEQGDRHADFVGPLLLVTSCYR